MAGQSVIVSVLGDTRHFQRSMKRMGTNFAILGAAAAAGAVAAGTALFKMADEADIASRKLTQIAETTETFGSQTATGVARLQDYASTLAALTGVSDESIQSVQGLILTFKSVGTSAGKTGGIFDRATQAALDLSAAGFGSAEGAAKQLGKALENPTKGIAALGKAGVTFTDEEKKKIAALQESGDLLGAQEIVMAAVEGQVKGTAEASASATAKMSEQFSEVGETIGGVLLPYVNDAATGILAWLKDPETMKAIEDLKTFLGNMFESFRKAFDNPAVKDVFTRLQNGAKVFMDFLNSPQGAGIIQGFADLVAGAFTVVSEGIMIASFLAHGLISLLSGKFGEMDMTYQEYKDRYFPTEYVDKGSWTNGGYGSTRMIADKSAGAITVNFNAPIDSVSAGREVSKVLASYSKANGGMRWA